MGRHETKPGEPSTRQAKSIQKGQGTPAPTLGYKPQHSKKADIITLADRRRKDT